MLTYRCSECGLVAHQDRAQDSYLRLGASLETVNVELLKVEETCKMAISSQALKDEGVETRRAASKGRIFLRWRDSPAHKHSIGGGSENYSVMNLEVAGSSPAAITTTNYYKIHSDMFTYYSLAKNKNFSDKWPIVI